MKCAIHKKCFSIVKKQFCHPLWRSLICTKTCICNYLFYKTHIYKPSFVQNSFVQYHFFTIPCLYKTWTYKTLFVQNLNLQNLSCTKLEKLISFPCIWSMLPTQGCMLFLSVLWKLQNQFCYTWSADLQPADHA